MVAMIIIFANLISKFRESELEFEKDQASSRFNKIGGKEKGEREKGFES